MPRFAAINKGTADRRRQPTPRWKLALKLSGFAVLGILIFLTWFWHTGYLAKQYEAFSDFLYRFQITSGLQLKKIRIIGRNHLSQSEILHAVGIQPGAPLSSFDLDQAFQAIKSLSWVHHVSIKRDWPDTLVIQIKERQPLALWQHKKKVALIDGEGFVITTEVNPFLTYPLVVGHGAPLHAKALLESLTKAPHLKSQIKEAIWVGDRRWNLVLKSGVTLKLPEIAYEHALQILEGLEAKQTICARAKKSIDLRLPKRMIIQ